MKIAVSEPPRMGGRRFGEITYVDGGLRFASCENTPKGYATRMRSILDGLQGRKLRLIADYTVQKGDRVVYVGADKYVGPDAGVNYLYAVLNELTLCHKIEGMPIDGVVIK